MEYDRISDMQTNKVTNVLLVLILLAVIVFTIIFFTNKKTTTNVNTANESSVEINNSPNTTNPASTTNQPSPQPSNQSFKNPSSGVTFSYPNTSTFLPLGTKISTPFLSVFGIEEAYAWYSKLTTQDIASYNQKAAAGTLPDYEQPQLGSIELIKTLGNSDENMERPTFITEYIGKKKNIQAKVIGKNDPVNETTLPNGQKYYSARVVYYFGHWLLSWSYGGNSKTELEQQRATLNEIVSTIDGI